MKQSIGLVAPVVRDYGEAIDFREPVAQHPLSRGLAANRLTPMRSKLSSGQTDALRGRGSRPKNKK